MMRFHQCKLPASMQGMLGKSFHYNTVIATPCSTSNMQVGMQDTYQTYTLIQYALQTILFLQ